MTTKTKEKPVKWKFNQDDYLELLESVDKNAKIILQLTHDVQKIKTRLGI